MRRRIWKPERETSNMKRQTQRNGFTLIELLIVTVVIVTLMGVVFRLAGAGGDNRARAVTIDRLQRIENALSGYYAAYGSYPPVPLQGRSRSIYKAVDGSGLQEFGEDETGNRDLKDAETVRQITAACRAQPISVCWPPSSEGDLVEALEARSEGYRAEGKPGFGVLDGVGALQLDAVNWRGTGSSGAGARGVQLFEFGLLSFLFPRYLFMLEGQMDNFYNNRRGQWAANNQLPCRLDNGIPFSSWTDVRRLLGAGSSNGRQDQNAGMISNLTSQVVCARWMPNFKGIVSTVNMPRYRYFYGVDVLDPSRAYLENAPLRIYTASGFAGSGNEGGSGYALLCMTVCDGWGNEFFYYSDPPYQSYRLWSAGPNGKTFPPWYDLKQFSGTDLNTIQGYISDDIVHLNN